MNYIKLCANAKININFINFIFAIKF